MTDDPRRDVFLLRGAKVVRKHSIDRGPADGRFLLATEDGREFCIEWKDHVITAVVLTDHGSSDS
jgi:hypothetical protein